MEEINNLIKECQDGKKAAQSKLYHRFAPKLLGVCLRYSRDQSEAEDNLHDGFVLIFQKIGQFRFQGSFEGWMKRVMVNVCLEKHRNKHRLYMVDDMQPFESNYYDDLLLDQLAVDDLLEIIKDLPPRYKLVFNMYAIEGYSHKEIAKELGISEGTSKSNLARARKILQDKVNMLEKEKNLTINKYAK